MSQLCDGDESNRPLDYAFRTYTILQDRAGASAGVSANISAIPVPVPDADEFTVALSTWNDSSIRP